jgi:RNA-binding protein 5/10
VRFQQQTDDGDDLKYADTIKLACLLCLRQFHSIDEIKRHNLLSALHKVF